MGRKNRGGSAAGGAGGAGGGGGGAGGHSVKIANKAGSKGSGGGSRKGTKRSYSQSSSNSSGTAAAANNVSAFAAMNEPKLKRRRAGESVPGLNPVQTQPRTGHRNAEEAISHADHPLAAGGRRKRGAGGFAGGAGAGAGAGDALQAETQLEVQRLTLVQCLNTLAALCTTLTSDPQNNMASLRTLIEVCELGSGAERDLERARIERAYARKMVALEKKRAARDARMAAGGRQQRGGSSDDSESDGDIGSDDDGSSSSSSSGGGTSDSELDSHDNGRGQNGNKKLSASDAARRKRRREKEAKLGDALVELHPVIQSYGALAPRDQAELRRLALLSGCAVFKDILPGYRIRNLSAGELAQQHSKEVKQLWDFEQGLLAGYRGYLQAAEQTLRQCGVLRKNGKTGNTRDPALLVLAEVATQCLCDLLSRHATFNFSTNIVDVLAPLCAGLATPARLSDIICTCFADIFASDTAPTGKTHVSTTEGDGAVASMMVKKLSELIKTRMSFCRPIVIDTFLALNLTEDLYETDIWGPSRKQNKLADQTKKQEKRREKKKSDHQLELDMKEAEARALKQERQSHQTELVKQVMLTYFRVLRHAPSDDGGIGEEAAESTLRRLLPAVLRGLAKFAYLINVELVTDVCNIFRSLLSEQHELCVAAMSSRLIEDAEAAAAAVLPCRLRLHCVATVFAVLRKHDPLTVDRKDFFGFLFNLLPETLNEGLDVRHKTSSADQTKRAIDVVVEPDACELAVACLEAATAAGGFGGRRGLANSGPTRAAAFVKRLVTVMTYWPPHAIMGGLAWVQQILQLHPDLEQLFAHERDLGTRGGAGLSGVGIGVPRAADRGSKETPTHLFGDPEHADGLQSALWEGCALHTHWHPDVRSVSSRMFRTPQLHMERSSSGDRARQQIGGLTQAVTFDDAFLSGKTPTQHTTHYRVSRTGDFQPIPRGIQAEEQRQRQQSRGDAPISKRQQANEIASRMPKRASESTMRTPALDSAVARATSREVACAVNRSILQRIRRERLEDELAEVRADLMQYGRYRELKAIAQESQ